MANEFDLPPEVMTLLARALPTMNHIEVLLLLRRTAPRSWSALDAAVELRANPDLVATALGDLATSRLAQRVPDATPAQFRFEEGNAQGAAAVTALAEVYERRPVTLIKALYRRPPSAVQAFADAFRLRSEDR